MEKYLIVYMSMELDDITLVLKELDDVAAKQRSIIFEKSRLSGKVPRDWKKREITFLFLRRGETETWGTTDL